MKDIFVPYEIAKKLKEIGLSSDKTPPKDYKINKNRTFKKKKNR